MKYKKGDKVTIVAGDFSCNQIREIEDIGDGWVRLKPEIQTFDYSKGIWIR